MSQVDELKSKGHVILAQQHRDDPRATKEDGKPAREVDVRVVLRQDGPRFRVIVEVADEDAVGDVCWYRLDFTRSDNPARNLQDARAAYEVIEGIVANMYEIIDMKNASLAHVNASLAQANRKIAELENRLRTPSFKPKPPPTVDPLAKEKLKIGQLLELAVNAATPENEKLNALRIVHDMIKKHEILKLKT